MKVYKAAILVETPDDPIPEYKQMEKLLSCKIVLGGRKVFVHQLPFAAEERHILDSFQSIDEIILKGRDHLLGAKPRLYLFSDEIDETMFTMGFLHITACQFKLDEEVVAQLKENIEAQYRLLEIVRGLGRVDKVDSQIT